MHSLKSIKLSPLASALFIAANLPSMAQAVEVSVDATEATDIGEATTTLEEALVMAAADSEDDVITFASNMANQTVVLNNHYQDFEAGNSLTIDGSSAQGLVLSIDSDTGGKALELKQRDLLINDLLLSLRNDAEASGVNTFISVTDADLTLENVVMSGFNPFDIDRHRVAIEASNTNVSLSNSTITGMFTPSDIGAAIDFRNNNASMKTLSLYNSIIQANGIDGAESSQSSIHVDSSWSELILDNTTISNNNTENGTAGLSVYSANTTALSVIIRDSVFNNNYASASSGAFGAINITADNSSETAYLDLNIDNTIFNGNVAADNSTLLVNSHNLSESNISLYNTIISDNQSHQGNVAIYNDLSDSLSMEVIHSTVINNTAQGSKPLQAAHFGLVFENSDYSDTFNAVIANSIVSGNDQSVYDAKEDLYYLANGDVYLKGGISASLQYSLYQKTDRDIEHISEGSLLGINVKQGVDPKLAGLALEGFSLPTPCLSETSPAINSASTSITNSFALSNDFTGNTRTADSAPDMGAVEYQSCAPDQLEDALEEGAENLEDLEAVTDEVVLSKKTEGNIGSYILASLFSMLLFRKRRP